MCNKSKKLQTKKSVETTIENTINTNQDGEVTGSVKSVTTKTVVRESEPPFMKLYLDDISSLNGIPPRQTMLLRELMNYAQYGTNTIIINKWIREKIQISMNKKIDTLNELKQTKEKNINDGSIRNGVSYLKKIGILENIATGVYRLNPYLFGFGKWEDIKKLRLTIEYKNNERTMVATTETEKIE